MMFKSEAPGRLDGKIFKRNSPFPEDDIMVRNEKIIAKSMGDYQSAVKSCQDQETLFANPLPLFDEKTSRQFPRRSVPLVTYAEAKL